MLMPLFPSTTAAASRSIQGPLSRRAGQQQSHGSSKKNNEACSPWNNRLVKCSIGASLLICMAANVWLFANVGRNSSKETTRIKAKQQSELTSGASSSSCRLREYPSHRYYHWSRELSDKSKHPSFLTDSEYIYGEWPKILDMISPPQKLCVDQSDWLPKDASSSRVSTVNTLPFADGTNPSIVSMQRLLQYAPSVHETIHKLHPTAKYIATACMTNSQCTWPEATPPQKPIVVLTVFMILDASFQSLHQTTITLERDSAWGRQPQPLQQVDQHATPALDDARLFVHDHQLWISYREGHVFGYESQVLNPVHFSVEETLSVYIKTSETTSFCCGRNMALMQDANDDDAKQSSSSSSSILRALTWVDPVTVEAVNTTPLLQQQSKPNKGRRLRDLKLHENETALRDAFINGSTTMDAYLPLQLQDQPFHRRLASSIKKKKSHIHGTNAFMVHLPDRNEYFGIGHFHRPPDRAQNPYARFGHHYTHCFYTITDQPPYVLTNLSPEFLLPAAAASGGSRKELNAAEMIQFLSGLEIVDSKSSSEKDRVVVIAYGINDCEAAVTTLPWQTVVSLMRPVRQNAAAAAALQVVDYMQPLRP
ncbi:hypothetical protein MPSEU_000581800 [Mayamaea pseudoterrestris]|nr:hypothetical protein MPSEU_000581800 [Mayamaea pseudoterrestris]